MYEISNAQYNFDKRGYRTTEWRLMYNYGAVYTRRKSQWHFANFLYLICLHIHLSKM